MQLRGSMFVIGEGFCPPPVPPIFAPRMANAAGRSSASIPFCPAIGNFPPLGPLFVPTRKANAKAFPVCRRVPSIRPDPQTIKALLHPKEIPRRGPRAYRICDTVRENRGPAPGKTSQGEAIEGPAFPRRFAGRGGDSCGVGANVRKNFPGGRLWIRVHPHI